MSIVHLDAGNFETEVLKSEIPVLVDFYADWCGPCRMIAPAMEELANEYAGKVKICKLNVDNAQDLAKQYNVMSIPTVFMFKGGSNVDSFMGALPKDNIKAFLDKHI